MYKCSSSFISVVSFLLWEGGIIIRPVINVNFIIIINLFEQSKWFFVRVEIHAFDVNRGVVTEDALSG